MAVVGETDNTLEWARRADVEVEAGGMVKAAAAGLRRNGGGLNRDRGWLSGGKWQSRFF
jgi:hypothetical protein